MIDLPSENIEYLLDTYAWIEYFIGSNKGEIVKKLIDSNIMYTSIISIAELSDKYYRENLIDEWNDRYKFILSKSYVAHLTIEIVKNSGPRKWKLSEMNEDIGLADAIIIETAIQKGLVIVSGDSHFKELENVLFLE
ncbi:MAG: type II toxin-antitoxin system VapC family toxin [Promethearchaeota archaeon]|nr:MAG: type II toxin-antitoxin system VapC family toxin [Candidatus Lokiarchaeota archaeon]